MKEKEYQKGEIVDVNLGKPPKEIKGHEQGFKRPCVIIRTFSHLGLAIVIPCTSKMQKYNYYTLVKLKKGSGGLSVDSSALCHQIRTISFDRISGKRGKLEKKNILKIQSVLIDILN